MLPTTPDASAEVFVLARVRRSELGGAGFLLAVAGCSVPIPCSEDTWPVRGALRCPGLLPRCAAAIVLAAFILSATATGCIRGDSGAPETFPGNAVAQDEAEVVERLPVSVRVGAGLREAILSGEVLGETDTHVPGSGRCDGWMSATTGHRVILERSQGIEVRITSAERPLLPLGLAVLPVEDGEVRTEAMRCVPVAPQGMALQIGELERGEWDVRVIAEEEGVAVPYRLRVTGPGGLNEVAESATFRNSGVPAEVMGEGRWGGARMRPDSAPVEWTGRAGGPRRADGLGLRCAGWIAEMPDHVLELTHGMPLRLRAEAAEGITIAVRREDGVWSCSDEHSLRHPTLLVALPAGRHEVFVGSLDAHGDPEYSLRVSR